MGKLFLILFVFYPIIAFGANGQNVHLQDANGLDFGSSANPIHVNLAGGGVTPGGNTKAVQYNNAGALAGDETVFAFTGSNVGINTQNPGARLTVKQTGSEDPFHVVSSSSTSLFKVAGTGNVGIGSSNPGVALDVNGSIRSTGTTSSLQLTQNNSDPSAPSSGTGIVYMKNDNNLYFQDSSAVISNLTTGGVWTNLNSTLSPTTTANNVGIGTVTAQAPLTISNSTQANDRIRLTGKDFNSGATVATNGPTLLLGVNSTNNRQIWLADSANLTRNSTNASMQFVIGSGLTQLSSASLDGSAGMPLNLQAVGGNVGIGTNAPPQKLSVVGAILMQGSNGKQWHYFVNSSPTNDFEIAETGVAARFYILPGGNVGIGTATPGQILDVTGNIRNSGSIFNSGITTDATKTDATVCEDTTNHQFYSGSGTLGICLGTSTKDAKTNILPVNQGLLSIMSLKPITFRYKNGWGYDPQKDYYGFLAEDVQKVLPWLVGHNTDGKVISADYLGMIPVMVKAMQQMQQEIKELQDKK